ncbi:hypothetical protein C8Q75DRAFT_166748 [Abortiporus biennis]|nr:hypothetical protein C8Q75DRAFT_166748 [Abortiporus biennis]
MLIYPRMGNGSIRLASLGSWLLPLSRTYVHILWVFPDNPVICFGDIVIGAIHMYPTENIPETPEYSACTA